MLQSVVLLIESSKLQFLLMYIRFWASLAFQNFISEGIGKVVLAYVHKVFAEFSLRSCAA